MPTRSLQLAAPVSRYYFFFVKVSLSVPHPRFSAAWILVFFVARWIMVRPSTHREAEILPAAPPHVGSPVSERPLTRQEIVQKLEELVRHPSTSDQHRAWARNRLDAFNQRTARIARETDKGRAIRHAIPRIQRRHLRDAAYVLLAIFAIDAVLATSGFRLLLREKVVQPGESYEARDWGDLGSYGKSVLVCWYWTGRSVIPEASWYGHGKHDQDECSLLHKHKSGE